MHEKHFHSLSVIDDLLWEKVKVFINASNNLNRVIFYSRFFQHSISEKEENYQINKIKSFVKKGDILYFEFRLDLDAKTIKEFGEHFRRYQSFDHFISKFDFNIFKLSYSYHGRGVARYKHEDPYVGRFIFEVI